ncbi:MAG: BrnT family toxin [Caldilineaceae bacterium]
MYNLAIEFEWDDNKDQINRQKHGVSFEVAKQIFDDPRALPFEDIEHSQKEARYKMIGLSRAGLLLVSFTYRKRRVRIISARRANAHLQRMYENDDYDY